MSFIHDDPELIQLLRLVERETGIDAALIEKDYWITHSLWALHRMGLEIWFKGGTSLCKGFGLIDRFSEDLDLMVERGTVSALPEVKSWTSTNKVLLPNGAPSTVDSPTRSPSLGSPASSTRRARTRLDVPRSTSADIRVCTCIVCRAH